MPAPKETQMAEEAARCLAGWKEIAYLVYVCKPGTPAFSDKPAQHMGQKSFADAVANVVQKVETANKKSFDRYMKANPGRD